MGIEHEISSIKKQQVAVTLKKIEASNPTPTSEPEIRQDISRSQHTSHHKKTKKKQNTHY